MGWAHVWVMESRKPQGKRSNVGSRINCVDAVMQLEEQSGETDGNGSGSFLGCVGTAGSATNVT